MIGSITDELVAWLREQVDEDERVARAALGNFRHDAVVSNDVHVYLARHDPARVLAEVAAKRRIIDAWQKCEDEMLGLHSAQEFGVQQGLELAVRLLASVYAGRPGWREEWAADEEAQRG